MDVSATRPTSAPDPARRAPVAPPAPPVPEERVEPVRPPWAPAAPAPPAPPDRDAPWVPSSTLKVTITSADVDARFEIDDQTNRVTVTMYERETGEVIREIPPQRLLDVAAALGGVGLAVDESR